MPFNINDFNAELNARGIAKPSLYEVMVFGPAGLADKAKVERNIPMRCIQIQAPGRHVNIVRHLNYGLETKLAQNVSYDEIQLTLLLSEDHAEREYIEKWIDMVVGKHRNGPPGPDMFDLGFYDDYVGTIEITNFNESAKIVHSTKLIDAYPTLINSEELAWADAQNIAVLPVQFSYRYYMNERKNHH